MLFVEICNLQSAICNCLAMFPRGQGFYFHPVKTAAVVVVYLAWVRTCWWVDHDCRELNLSTAKWNPIVLLCGVAGLALVWMVPVFWASCLALVTLYLAPTLLYVGTRNEIVPPDKRVLTPHHFQQLAARYLSLNFRKKAGEGKDKVLVDVVTPDDRNLNLFVEGPTPDWGLPVPKLVEQSPPGVKRFAFALEGVPPGVNPEGAALKLTLVGADRAYEFSINLE